MSIKYNFESICKLLDKVESWEQDKSNTDYLKGVLKDEKGYLANIGIIRLIEKDNYLVQIRSGNLIITDFADPRFSRNFNKILLNIRLKGKGQQKRDSINERLENLLK